MIHVERTVDLDLVRRIANDERIYSQMSDDFAPPAGKYEPSADGAVYLAVFHDGTPVGLFVLVPKSRARIEVHTMLLPNISPWRKLEAAAMGLAWIWSNTKCERVFTEVPTVNRAAEGFARAAGMTQSGVEPKCFLKGGVLYDVLVFGVNRPHPSQNTGASISE